MAAPKLIDPVYLDHWQSVHSQSVLLLRQCFSLHHTPPLKKPLPTDDRFKLKCSQDQMPSAAPNLIRSSSGTPVRLPNLPLMTQCKLLPNDRHHSTQQCTHTLNKYRHSGQYLVNPARHKFKRIHLTRMKEPPYLCAPLPSATTLDVEQLLRDQPRKIRKDNALSKLRELATMLDNPIPVPLQPCSIPHSNTIADNSCLPDSQVLREILRRNKAEEQQLHVGRTDACQSEAKTRHISPHPLKDKPTPAQLAYVLLKLREELPAFFDGHHTFGTYAPDMRFESSLTRFAWTTTGCSSYRLFLTSSRLVLRCCYSQLSLDLLKITKEVEGGKIEARWRVRGCPRLWWKMQKRVILDGFSTFVVNPDGLIAVHKMDRVMPSHKERSRVLTWMAQLGMLLGLSHLSPGKLEPQPP